MQVLQQVEQVAESDSTVLIQGETGTGKELIAQAIHRNSSRRQRTLVIVNCAALPSNLIESELFGREKGAYTGALSQQAGRFELADGSTIVLDEIGELPLELQPKLLRVLQEGQFERLGSSKTRKVDVRVLAATNRNLAQMVEDGSFREDLYYRLNVFPIMIPPLRERPEDIPLLIQAFIKQLRKKNTPQIERIPRKVMTALQCYSWPGNVRELHNVIEHALILSKGKSLQIQIPKQPAAASDQQDEALEEVERRHILSVLERSDWRVRGRQGAAERLQLKPTTLEYRMKKLGIQRPEQ
jgi:transcriptional regulator with GAF, ATPase, and Fis domain